MVSSFVSSANAGKDSSMSLATLAEANSSLSSSVATLTDQVSSLTLMVESLLTLNHNLHRAPQSQSPTSTLVAPAVPPTEYNSDDEDRLSYITDPGEGVTPLAPAADVATVAPMVVPALAGGAPAPAGPGPATVPAPAGGAPAPAGPGPATVPAGGAPAPAVPGPAGGAPAPAPGQYHSLDVDPSLRWYLVTVGHAVGVFQGWENVAPLVLGARGAIFNRQPNQEAALSRFNEARTLGLVRVV
ncbi:hypothetical protein PC9H_008827 [Pleurotus ostreatus]|uniref:Ribonuclease H1 N-terminal domain-containing protein n=2 Tax=Pleurotus TaxID=5320 RepID=A0A8H6ZPJ3_PLEOS|nr:uncharacterized protein PC9H_008827 [Pleurotus ostreatus]KAF7426458.1 hypothetical protein PC9H_008827 [Pleurotus ostreatus]KAG9221973.1 hypothetical protein CCMSSC00406_0009181 [Pleurotus cornucopiae]